MIFTYTPQNMSQTLSILFLAGACDGDETFIWEMLVVLTRVCDSGHD
jgi:hypothetical protein